MISEAQRRNASTIKDGRVELRQSDVASQQFTDDTFDEIYAINMLYFLSDVDSTLRKLHRVMKPGGRIALVVGDKEEMVKEAFTQTGAFALFTGDEIVHLLHHADFVNAHYQTLNTRAGIAVCGKAEKAGNHELPPMGLDGT
jgi:ubiquinone/menaquinone biosynthesis C-methylase UbiE